MPKLRSLWHLLAPPLIWGAASAVFAQSSSLRQITPEAAAPKMPAASSASMDALGRVKHPLSWLSWGADLRLRYEHHENATTLQNDLPLSIYSYQRYRPRLWTLITPSKNLEIDARVVNEFRTYQKPDDHEEVVWNEVLLDHLNVRFQNLFGQPLSLVVGRQDFTFGDKWIIWDGTTTDGSRTEFFDAARFTFDWRQARTKIDAIYFDQAADTDRWLPPLYSEIDAPLNEQNQRGAILYGSTRKISRTQLDGYFIYQHNDQVLADGINGELYVFGARAEGRLSEHWQYLAEFAPQFGHKDGAPVNAFGWNSLVSYFVRDSWNHNFRVGYEYLSGDNPATGANEGWDPLWGRRAQWSELLVFTFGEENGRSAEWSNLQRLDLGWSCNPTRVIELLADYMPLFANTNPYRGQPGFSDDGHFRGHLLKGIVKFNFSEHVTGHLWSEFFWPGDYYAPDHRDPALFLRAELFLKL